jgi:tyrosyl-tRNA synthetase
LRSEAAAGARHPRDVKVDLAKRIITDFHSARDANAAEEDFNRVFKRKEMPDEIETREVEAATWTLPRLLVRTELAPSVGEARRLIEQGGVRIGGVRQTDVGVVVAVISGEDVLLQVGKRRFLRVRGT